MAKIFLPLLSAVDERRKKRRLEDAGSPSDAGTPTPQNSNNWPPIGAQVAVQPLDQEWLLATLVAYRPGEKMKCEVEDVDVDESTGAKRWVPFWNEFWQLLYLLLSPSQALRFSYQGSLRNHTEPTGNSKGPDGSGALSSDNLLLPGDRDHSAFCQPVQPGVLCSEIRGRQQPD
jgi:hypothetical protein